MAKERLQVEPIPIPAAALMQGSIVLFFNIFFGGHLESKLDDGSYHVRYIFGVEGDDDAPQRSKDQCSNLL